jgi:hypothetical protein
MENKVTEKDKLCFQKKAWNSYINFWLSTYKNKENYQEERHSIMTRMVIFQNDIAILRACVPNYSIKMHETKN